ncbi:MAG TPA: hypothetical protein ENI80_10020 [Acidiferrobacteraceae bacterium]|nr:hypothetical protein [Acidiferrobacteraceae bacterium]
MMKRIMIIPAAGTGSRLGASAPKVLVRVNGQPMLDYLFELYAPVVDLFVVVVSPGAEEEVRRFLGTVSVSTRVALQQEPTGMLDAILIPTEELSELRPAQIWITWCDQIAVCSQTVHKLAQATNNAAGARLVFPTIQREHPYIHFQRDKSGVITGIAQQREGDTMPQIGENDMGLFVLSDSAYFDLLPCFSRETGLGDETKERNFLPFTVWMQRHGVVQSLPGTHYLESIGVNTQAELKQIEQWLLDR